MNKVRDIMVRMGDPDPEGIAALVQRLIRDAKIWARAEVELYKTIAADKLGDVKQAAIFGVGAGTLAFAGLITFLVGMTIALSTLVGPFLATLIVTGITFAIAALMGRVAMRAIKRARGAGQGE